MAANEDETLAEEWARVWNPDRFICRYCGWALDVHSREEVELQARRLEEHMVETHAFEPARVIHRLHRRTKA